jgi:allophanate hydrolase
MTSASALASTPDATPDATVNAPHRPGHAGIAHWLEATTPGPDLVQALNDVRARALQAQPLHVWVHLCPPSAWAAQLDLLLTRLHSTDDRPALLRRFPLLGVPFAVKDNIDIAAEPTSAACPAFTYAAQQHATVVQKLLDAGALWVGKTNLDQFATGLVGTRSPYGRPASVASAAHISGGSSSGSAVAVARGLVAFALGTDTAGSGRIPAAFNGLVGYKPTPGRVSSAGVVPACRSLDTVSIFAHSASDAAHVLAVIEGADDADSFSHFAPGPAQLGQSKRLRVGVPRQAPLDADCGYPAAWARARERAQALGHTVVELDFTPLWQVGAMLYDGPWVAERHAACRAIFEGDAALMDSSVRQVISKALGLTATQTFEALYRLRDQQASLRAWWHDVDLLLVPSAPTHPSFEQVDAQPLAANAQLGTYANFVNLLGWCAMALPAGSTSTGLPFGVTAIAPAQHDAALLPWAHAWLDEQPPPAPWLRTPAAAPVLHIAVVGAHLTGLPLNGQLRERGGHLVESTATASHYRLFALPGTTPPKPGLLRTLDGDGACIAIEIWALPQATLGSFLALIPPPLGLGSIELADGRYVHGFLCESHALAGARDITQFGGWRAYLNHLSSTA